ncbi:unnamed protein product [Discula destructiva]
MGSSTDETFAFSVKTDSWDHYAKYRPSYPESMWSTWLEYHQGPLDTIMDVGTGGGIGAAGLLAVAHAQGKQVKRVCLSDPNDDNLSAAKKNFTPERFPGVEFLFHRGPAEDPFPGLLPRSVDMLISCASIHWMDIDIAMATFADTLRPGGTFGAVVYPQPTVKGDNEVAEALGEVFEQRRRFQDASDALNVMQSIRARCYRNLSIGLDYVPFAKERWTSVRRRTANLPEDGKWPLRDSSWSHYGEPKLAVAEGEEYEQVETDENYVRKGYTVEQLKEFFQTLGYEPFVMDGRLWETNAFRAFDAIVKSRGGNFDLVWPVATTLARAK